MHAPADEVVAAYLAEERISTGNAVALEDAEAKAAQDGQSR